MEKGLGQPESEAVLEVKLKEAERLKHSETEKSKKLAEEVFKHSSTLKYKIRSAIVISHILTNRGDFYGAKSIIDKAKKIAQANKLLKEKAQIIPYLANIYLKFGQIDQALRIYQHLENEAKSINYIDGVIMSNTGIGICNMYLDPNDSSAAHYFHIALSIANETENRKFQGFINNNLGRLYLERKEYKKAINYLEKSLPLFRESMNKRSVARSLLVLAKVYFETANYQKANEISKKAYLISTQQRDYQNLIHINILQGKILDSQLSQSSTNVVKNYYENAISIAGKYGLKIDLQEALIAYGNSLATRGLTDKSINILNQGLELATILKNKKKIAETQRILSEIYEKKGLYQLALDQYKKQAEYHIDENKLQSDRVVNDLEVKYKVGETNLKLQKSRFESKLKDQEYQQNRKVMMLTIGVLSLIIAFIYLNYRASQKNTRLLYEKNEAILIAKNTEITKNKEIESARAEIKGQESERKRLAQELHDGLGGTLAAIKLNLSVVQKKSEDPSKLITIIDKLDNACNEVRTISHHLSPRVFQDNGIIDAIHDYFNDVKEGFSIDLTVEIFPKNEIEEIAPAIKNDLYRIVQELTNNSIKHANASRLDVQLIKHEDYLSLMIEDDGDGFSIKDKVDGIGLKNIRSRIILLNGSMNIESQPGEGTLIDLKIPV